MIRKDPILKKRVMFSPKDPSKVTLKLRGEEDPLRLCETFVRKLLSFGVESDS